MTWKAEAQVALLVKHSRDTTIKLTSLFDGQAPFLRILDDAFCAHHDIVEASLFVAELDETN